MITRSKWIYTVIIVTGCISCKHEFDKVIVLLDDSIECHDFSHLLNYIKV
jgi:hypothetical protein